MSHQHREELIERNQDRSASPHPLSAVSTDAAPHVSGPTLLGMAGTVTKAAVTFAASGFKTVGADVHRVRVEQCSGCPYRQNNRCRVCGCFFDKKAWLPHEDCPLGKWLA